MPQLRPGRQCFSAGPWTRQFASSTLNSYVAPAALDKSAVYLSGYLRRWSRPRRKFRCIVGVPAHPYQVIRSSAARPGLQKLTGIDTYLMLYRVPVIRVLTFQSRIDDLLDCVVDLEASSGRFTFLLLPMNTA